MTQANFRKFPIYFLFIADINLIQTFVVVTTITKY